MTHARVLVVGDGVAGAASCVALARAGVRALWLVRTASGARNAGPDSVGESLSPSSKPLLEELGLGDILASPRHRSANVTFSAWGSDILLERSAVAHPLGGGWVIDRRHFETQMCDAASARATRLAGQVAQIAARPGGGFGLVLGCGAQITADFLIDATGRAAAIGRRLSRLERIDRLVAATAFLQQRDTEVEPTRATLIEASAQGWWYATLLHDGRLALACFSDPDLLPRAISRDPGIWRDLLAQSLHVGRWVADAGFALDAPPRLVSAGTARLASPCTAGTDRGGWAAVGDAAVAFDPLSSHGLATALWTGARAGAAAAEWLAGSRQPLAEYGRAVRLGFDAFLQQRGAIYRHEQRFANQPFWRRRQLQAPGSGMPTPSPPATHDTYKEINQQYIQP